MCSLPVSPPLLSSFISGYPLPVPPPPPNRNPFNNLLFIPPILYNTSNCQQGVYVDATLQVNSTIWTNFTQACKYNLTINVQTNLINGGSSSSSSSSSSSLSSSVSSLSVPSSVSYVSPSTPVYSCIDYLDSSTLSSLGVIGTYSCSWTTVSTLAIVLGTNAQVKVGQLITLNTTSAVMRSCAVAPQTAAVGSVAVQVPASSLIPTVTILGPSTISSCQDLLLSVQLFNVSGTVTYVWSGGLLSVGSAGTTSIPAGATVSTVPAWSNYPTNESTLFIPSAALVASTPQQSITYAFSVYVVSSIGIKSPAAIWTVKERSSTHT